MKRLFTKNGSLLTEADGDLAYFETDTYRHSKNIVIKTPHQRFELELESDSYGDMQISKLRLVEDGNSDRNSEDRNSD